MKPATSESSNQLYTASKRQRKPSQTDIIFKHLTIKHLMSIAVPSLHQESRRPIQTNSHRTITLCSLALCSTDTTRQREVKDELLLVLYFAICILSLLSKPCFRFKTKVECHNKIQHKEY